MLIDPDSAAWTCVAGDKPPRWPLVALLIGQVSGTELAEGVDALCRQCDATVAPSMAAALALLVDLDDSPDLIVLAATRPGAFSDNDVERLRNATPLARLVALLGSWCEGETRSGHPWPAVPRVYWHQWPGWLEAELSALASGACGSLSLPLTATDEERLLHANRARAASQSLATTPLRVAIHSANRPLAALLAAACRDFGHEPQVVALSRLAFERWYSPSLLTAEARVTPSPHAGKGRVRGSGAADANHTTIGIWDLATGSAEELAALRTVAERQPGVPWIVLAGFPRDEDRRRALACGAREVLSKPLVIDQLRAAIDRAAEEVFAADSRGWCGGS